MKTQEFRDQLNTLKVPGSKGYFAMKQYGGGPDESFIEANKNGIIGFTEMLLESIDESNNRDTYSIPVEFYDDESEVIIDHIRIRENNTKSGVAVNEPLLTKIGCAAACLAVIVVFISGCISIISWISDLF